MNNHIDILIIDGIIITMHDQQSILYDHAIAIKDTNIIALLPKQRALETYTANHVINAHNKLIMPGFINGHTHAALSLLRGLIDDKKLAEWLKLIWSIEKHIVNSEFVYWGTQLACYEMLLNGITTFVDSYFYADITAQVAQQIGMRAVVGQTVMNKLIPKAQENTHIFTYVQNFLQKWTNTTSLIKPAIAPHSAYTCNRAMLQASKELSQEYNSLVLTHLAETQDELAYMRKNYNTRPVAYLDREGLINNRLIAAHAIYINKREIAELKHAQVGIIYNPESNMKLASGIAPVPALLKSGICVGLGTDSAVSNNTLDMFHQIKTGSLLQKIATQDPEALPAYQALSMATSLGAQAIHWPDIGTIEPHKKADIIILDTKKLHQIPCYNIYSHLVYAYTSADVETVIVNGKIKVLKQKLYDVSEQELAHLQEKVAYYKRKIIKLHF